MYALSYFRRTYLLSSFCFHQKPFYHTLSRQFFLNFKTTRHKKMSAVNVGNFSRFEDLINIPSMDFFFTRAVHYVAARKEKTPPPEENVEAKNSVDDKIICSDITNKNTVDGDKIIKPPIDQSLPLTSIIPNDETTTEITNPKIADDDLKENLENLEKLKTPLERFRGRYLIVTDFTSQLWCEQQLAYNFDPPPGVVITEKPQMAKGSDLHLSRELEVQEIVEVKIASREDAFALKLLNIIACLRDFLSGDHGVRREVPIFGMPFNLDIFVVGVIDEVRFDGKAFSVDIGELKTRQTARLPSRAQKRAHNLQVMLYKRMWNDLVVGQLRKEDILKHMKLTADAPLGEDMHEQIRRLGGVLDNDATITIDSLLAHFLIESKSLPTASKLFVEYCHQETGDRFAVDPVDYDETWLRRHVENFSGYWRGEREPKGVDIEDAWKCKFCDFADVCEWRAKKQLEYASKNGENFVKGTYMLPSTVKK